MTRLAKESGIIYEFNKDNTPVITIASGSTLTMETYDCFTNQIQTENAVMNEVDWDKVNPATGPVFVEGAEPGDILQVKIGKIELDDQGTMVVVPGLGLMGDVLEKSEANIMKVKDNKVVFNNVEVPVNKMIGVIGVAPEDEGVNCGIPGAHGGNMDTTLMTEGATLYLPVAVEGALFALGDLHLAMGDGEVSGSGVEVAGEVTVTIDVIKGEEIFQPILENDDVFVQLASAESLDVAANLAGKLMIERIVEKTQLPVSEVAMMMSMAGQNVLI